MNSTPSISRRPKILDLYSCAGGAAMGYHRAGFEVFGVDVANQPHYPFPFYKGDAIATLQRLLEGQSIRFRDTLGDRRAMALSNFDAVHTSPPCQSYLNLGAVNRKQGRTYDHPDLIAETRELLIETGLPYIIENVEDARSELREPVRVCGTALNRPLRRHRLFESNINLAGLSCHHDRFTEKKYWTGWRPNGETRLSTVVQVYGNAGGQGYWASAMGISWMTPKEMIEAVPPDYTRYIGRQVIDAIIEQRAA